MAYVEICYLLFSASGSISVLQAADVAAGFVGRWVGPEDSSLEIVARQHDYEVSLMGVDGSGVFTGTIDGGGMRMERNGQVQRIRHVSGPETGVKYLADKRDCVVMTSGEGFCRD